MLVKQATTAGKISTGNTKMPGTTYAIDAFACNVGAKLRNIKGSTCNQCYAIKLQKLRPSVDQGWKANLSKFNAVSRQFWIDSMVFQLNRYNTDGFHRWFDAGDLQSIDMLRMITAVALRTPHIKHWIPTRERAIVAEYLRFDVTPENLVIRLSAAMVNGAPNTGFKNTSTVHFKAEPIGNECKAYTRKNNCGDCRMCWDETVKNISYKKH